MIKLVIGLNIAIALFGFYIAWRIWLLKRALTSATVALTTWERNTHQVLNPESTPDLILRGQATTAFTRKRYVRLQQQLQQLQRIFSIALIFLQLFQSGIKQRRSRMRNR